MLGQRVLGDLPDEAARAPTYDTNPTSFSSTTVGACAQVLAEAAIQATGSPPADVAAAVAAGFAAVRIMSEQKADSAVTTARVARVLWAPRKLLLQSLGIVVDSIVPADPADYVTFTLKKHADGAALSSAIADPLTTHDLELAARTLRLFTWTGDILLEAGDMLVVDVSKAGVGVLVPKFMFVGNARSI